MSNLNNPLVLLGILLLISLLVCIIVYIVLPLAIKKGYPINEWINKADDFVTKTDSIIDLISKYTKNTAIAPVVNTVDVILKAAKTGVDNAEQLYLIGTLDKEKRKVEAKNYVTTVLKELKIEITPEREKIVEGAIESAVLGLGHGIKQ